MVEGGRLPAGGGMALDAVLAELALVGVILGVAIVALGGRAFEDRTRGTLYVALVAGHFKVSAGEREVSHRMIEIGRRPVLRGMAVGAVLAKLAVVGIVFGVAGVTILRGILQVGSGFGPGVALLANHGAVLTG